MKLCALLAALLLTLTIPTTTGTALDGHTVTRPPPTEQERRKIPLSSRG